MSDPESQPPPRGLHGCRGTTKAGKPCGGKPIRGTDVCRLHGGLAPQVRTKGAIRATVRAWDLDTPHVDPGEVLLRMVTATFGWWAWLRARLDEALDAAAASAQASDTLTDTEKQALTRVEGRPPAPPHGMPAAVGALIGVQYVYDELGHSHASGEYMRRLVLLEATERSRAADLAAKAVHAGLAERQVRLAEKQGELLATVVEGLLAELGHDLKDPKTLEIAQRHLRLVTGGQGA